MKKIIALLLTLMLIVAFTLSVGCKKAEEPKPAEAPAPAPEASPAPAPEASPAPAPEPSPAAK